MFRQDSRTRFRVLPWAALRRARGYWLRTGTGYRSVDGTIDAICEPLVISRYLRLVEIEPGDVDTLTPLFGWTGAVANDPSLLNSGCRSTHPRRMRLARMDRAR